MCFNRERAIMTNRNVVLIIIAIFLTLFCVIHLDAMFGSKFVKKCWRKPTHVVSVSFDLGDSLCKAGVWPGSHSECMAWALGDDWENLKLPGYPNAWNARHKNIGFVDDFDDPVRGTMLMGYSWLAMRERRKAPTLHWIDDIPKLEVTP